jgi:hypothetical protein
MCNACRDSNFTKSSDGSCVKCEGGSSAGAVAGVMSACFAVLYIAMAIAYLKADGTAAKTPVQKKEQEQKETLEEHIRAQRGMNAASRLVGDQVMLGRLQGSGEGGNLTESDTTRSDMHIVIDRVKVFYSWLQVFTATTVVFDVAWPVELKGMTLGLSFVNFDIGGLFSMTSCTFALPFLSNFKIHMLLPAILLVVLVLARLPAHFLRKSKMQRQGQRALMVKMVISVSLIIYPGLCVKLFTTLKCIEIEGVGVVMAAAYKQFCYEGEHAEASIIAVLCIVVWVVGIPSGVLLALWINRKYLYDHKPEHRERHEDVVREFGTLFLQYEVSPHIL